VRTRGVREARRLLAAAFELMERPRFESGASDYRSGVLRGVLVKESPRRGVADYAFTTE
jgi:hypothetical protein